MQSEAAPAYAWLVFGAPVPLSESRLALLQITRTWSPGHDLREVRLCPTERGSCARCRHLRRAVTPWRTAGERIALVPTMGALHAGHLALVRAARRRARRVVVSIFVNPAQFAPHEDFATYPRTFDADVAALAEMAVDLVWAPSVAVMYPPRLCHAGSCPRARPRPGSKTSSARISSAGVATVVGKLLIQCAPDFAMFGEKDYQQLKVVTRLAQDLDLPVEDRRRSPTVREPDGLALSSRNAICRRASARQRPRCIACSTDCAGQDRKRRIAGARARRRRRGDRARGLRARLSRSPPRRDACSRSRRSRTARSGCWWPPASARRG